MKSMLFLGAAIALVLGVPVHAADSAAKPKATIGAWGVDTSGLSKTVRPGDDFYRYVNEGWLKATPIPTGLAAIDAGTEVYLSTEQRVAGIIAGARALSDNHSAGEFRVNGIVRNIDAWYEAFNVKPGNKLYLPPEKRVKIW